MTYTEAKKKISSFLEVGFTIAEAKQGIRDAAKKTTKMSVADKIAASQQKAGTYNYGFTGKEYGNRKWGKQ
jgi:hypothetical protein